MRLRISQCEEQEPERSDDLIGRGEKARCPLRHCMAPSWTTAHVAFAPTSRHQAVSAPPRHLALLGEFVPGYEASTWFGVGAPKNTPSQIIDKLNKEINAGHADPKLKAQLASLGGTVLPGSPADFAKLIAEEIEKWGKVVKSV